MVVSSEPGADESRAAEAMLGRLEERMRLVRSRLAGPGAWTAECCVGELEAALRELSEIEGYLRAGRPVDASTRTSLRDSVRRLQVQVRSTGRLLENGSGFLNGLVARLESECGYSEHGVAGSIEQIARRRRGRFEASY